MSENAPFVSIRKRISYLVVGFEPSVSCIGSPQDKQDNKETGRSTNLEETGVLKTIRDEFT